MSIYKSHGNTTSPNYSSDSNKPVRFGSKVIDLKVITETGRKFTNFSAAPIKLTFPVKEVCCGLIYSSRSSVIENNIQL